MMMFNIGDVIIYSTHGLSQIDDICEKTISDVTRTYYVLHPLGQANLTISTPVDNEKIVMLKLLNREEAEEILQSFKLPGISWIVDVRQRNKDYHKIVNTGDRKEIAKVANTLMRKELELSLIGKKVYDQDRKLLKTIQDLLFNEIASAFDTTVEEVFQKVYRMIK
ncbi:CarD family transcriptional regulator [Neobacillus sp. FSL H8-0543]|uniref:CarD family transcriptional regulator n=1 Tax=Neobacillus sp. FSL H8-0543 TaxID=2954672 RepID=UPI00315913ED